MRRSGAGMPVDASSSIARTRAFADDMFRCVVIVSINCSPTVYSGFNDVSGS